MNEREFCYKYPHPALTADIVVIANENKETFVLLIQRKNPPYQNCWAFPGGFMEIDETIEQCAIRELQEETNIKAKEIELIGIYSSVNRDPRDRVVTAAYLTQQNLCQVKGQDDAKQAKWFNIKNLPPLAFDHEQIFTDAIKLIEKNNILYTNNKT